MDHLDNPFTIEIAGASIARIGDNDDELTQAKTGDDAAVFTLKNSRLQSGAWILGRYLVEDRSLLPKKLLWVKAESDGYQLHPVTAEKSGEAYKLSFNGSSTLIAEEGKVFVNLMGEDQGNVLIKLKE